jgi:pimeloyl-ACP methyl ester carboxylesterase
MRRPILIAAACAALAACTAAPPQDAPAPAPARVLSFDRTVDHVSAVPAIKGQHATLALHEEIAAAVAGRNGGKVPSGRVVLFVNAGLWPSAVAYDLPDRDYSWMRFLARAGYDVFAVDLTGYGGSARPKMDDPCNVDPKRQPALIPKPLKAACKPGYPFNLVTSDSEDADIDAAVDFILKLRGVSHLALIGWAEGGMRVGRYAVRHPYKVDRLVIVASAGYGGDKPSAPPKALPAPGFPIRFESRETALAEPWTADAKCPNQIDPAIRDAVWTQAMAGDPVGASWGPGGLRAPTGSWWGWSADAAAKIRVPTLIMIGADDTLLKSNSALYVDLGTTAKVLLTLQCASHYPLWEAQLATVQKASLQWLDIGTVSGVRIGRLRAAPDGTITVVKPPKPADDAAGDSDGRAETQAPPKPAPPPGATQPAPH